LEGAICSALPQKRLLPQLQVSLQVVEEVEVVPLTVGWSPRMPRVVSLYSSRSRE
jgi:hypothetical protein